MVALMVIENDAATSAAVRAEVARARRTHKSVSAALGIPQTRWHRRLRNGDWQIGELKAIAAELRIPLQRLTSEEE